MLSTTFFGRFAPASALNVADMPPADWCMTTLQTLTNKYEHLTSGRKANPPYAEAVLNSFKSKLLNVVSSHSLYDSDDNSEGEAEWPLGAECSSYMDMKQDTDTSNYLAMTPAALADAASAVCFAEEAKADTATGLPSPSPSPPEASAAGDAGADSAADFMAFGASDEMVVMPINIEDALRRILANNSCQVLGNTFTTFAEPDDTAAKPSSSSSDLRRDEEDSDSESAHYMSESGSSSPESLDPLDSPNEPDPAFLAAADPVDIFVKGFSSNGSWESVQSPRPADGSLTPCKRKRNTDKEDRQAEADAAAAEPPKAIRLGALPVSPRKRSRSAGHSDSTAAVPSAPAASAQAAPPAEKALAAAAAAAASV